MEKMRLLLVVITLIAGDFFGLNLGKNFFEFSITRQFKASFFFSFIIQKLEAENSQEMPFQNFTFPNEFFRFSDANQSCNTVSDNLICQSQKNVTQTTWPESMSWTRRKFFHNIFFFRYNISSLPTPYSMLHYFAYIGKWKRNQWIFFSNWRE